MEIDKNPNVGQKGRFYLTKSIWLPQEPIEKLNLKMSDMILRRMPRLPLGGDDALKIFPVLGELRKSHDKIKADLQYLLSHHEEIPALHEVNAAISRIPGVHTALFSILAGGAEIEPHRGSAAGVIRFHYPLIVPTEPEKCWIEIGGYHFFWEEGVPLVFDDTREHWVKNQTDQTRVVLIIDFNADMPFPVNLYTGLRYNLIRRSAEVKAVIKRAAIGVPPRASETELARAA
jgi:beta-hydroxylase